MCFFKEDSKWDIVSQKTTDEQTYSNEGGAFNTGRFWKFQIEATFGGYPCINQFRFDVFKVTIIIKFFFFTYY